MIQWHPLFASLLRPIVEESYDVQVNVSVGEAPRSADIVLLQRKKSQRRSFKGIWRSLTFWNVLEFKSPAVHPTIRDVDALVELGLGIDRRLSERRARESQRLPSPSDVSFWYLANRLSKPFLQQCSSRFGRLKVVGPGIWRTLLLHRHVVLVSNTDLRIDSETLPLHVVSHGSRATELAVVRFVLDHPELRTHYAHWLLTLHNRAYMEARTMSRLTEEPEIDLRPAIDYLGLDRVIAQVGLDRVIAQVGLDQVIAQVGLDQVIALVGLDRVIAQVGVDQIVKHIGVDGLLAHLTPSQIRELKKRLK